MSAPVLVEKRLPIPPEVELEVTRGTVTVRHEGTALTRDLTHPSLEIVREGDEVAIRSPRSGKRIRAQVGTVASHIRNMLDGVTQGFTYTLKVVYAHFPVKVGVQGDRVVIQNFLGERHPRSARILGEETRVEVKGDTVTVTGPDVEAVSQTAANIEQATRIKNKDPRVFQDGIYLVDKGGP